LGISTSRGRLVAFKELNLIGDWPMRGRFDVIFCRNVVIFQLLDLRARLQRVGGCADHVDLRIAAQDGADQAAHGGAVVDDQDADGFAHARPPSL